VEALGRERAFWLLIVEFLVISDRNRSECHPRASLSLPQVQAECCFFRALRATDRGTRDAPPRWVSPKGFDSTRRL
jgi:hypothetical protein